MSEEAHNDAGKNNASVETSDGAECSPHVVEASTNVSQTNIGQMTASSVAPHESLSKWNCEVCTYENFAMSKKCTMCRNPKPLLNEDIFRLQEGAAALPPPSPAHDVCDAEAIAERLKPLRISSPQGQASASCVAKWPCPTCTFENWPKSLKCAMCGSANPSPSHHPAESKPGRPSIGINDIFNSQHASIHDIHDLDASRRTKKKNPDWLWLQACLGVVEGSPSCVDAYLRRGGDPARALDAHEVQLLSRPSAFDVGHTLVHLAIRFQRQDILSMLLSRISGGGPGLKRSPSYIAPDIAAGIRRHVAGCVRYKKGAFPCRYINEFCTFTLPSEISELPAAVQEQLFTELLDQDAQRDLDTERKINWSPEYTHTLGSRLYALWNRSAGDCLTDATLQAAYGVADRDSTLRAPLADSLHRCRQFYSRWSAWERLQATLLHYTPEESQLRGEWTRLVHAAATPRHSLHQLHVFALAHVVRRPVLVYGIDVVNSFRGEALGFAGFQGIYLPLLWDSDVCSRSPLCLGYTRGHFCALVTMDPHSHYNREEEQEECTYLPLTDADGKMLPIHFLTCEEISEGPSLLHRWLSITETGGGLAARCVPGERPLRTGHMLHEYLNHYRQQALCSFPPRLRTGEFRSDPDTEDE